MKKRIYLLSSLVLTAFLFFACSTTDYNDDDTASIILPVLTTTDASNITDVSATIGGKITSDGGVPVSKSGIVYGTSPAPTLTDHKTTDGGFGTYTSSLTGLTGNTTYYARAYATNPAGTGYGNEITFKTGPIISTVVTTTATAITADKATTGGNVSSDGGSTVTERGIVWSILENPTVDDVSQKIPDTAGGTGTFVSNITGLSAATKYFVRAYAINGIGTSYGPQISFTTSN